MGDVQQLYDQVDTDQDLYGDWQREDSLRARPLFTVLWLITLAVIGIMVLRMTPNGLDGKKYIPVVVAFVPWMACVSAVTLVCALIGRRRALAVVCTLCLLTQLCWHWGYIWTSDERTHELPSVSSLTGGSADRYARVMTLNTKNGLADAQQIVRTVREEHVEVLTLQEANTGLLQRLAAAGLGSALPYSVVAAPTGHDNGGVNVLYTAAKPVSTTGDLIAIEASSVPSACVRMASRTVCFGSVHPFSPRPRNQGLWNSGLDSIAKLQSNARLFVLMGDFNSTWDHASFRFLLGDRFVDTGEQNGSWFHMTYPSNITLFGGRVKVSSLVEIDHIVHDRSVVVGDLETVTIAGSDHKALLGTLDVED